MPRNFYPIPKAMLEKETKYFEQHKEELLKKFKGKYIIIVGEEVVGWFDSEKDAYFEAVQKYGAGNFLIQVCDPDGEEPVQVFHSRVAF